MQKRPSLRRLWRAIGLLAALIGIGAQLVRAEPRPAARQPSRVFLPLIAQPGAPPAGGGPSSAELIEAALGRGEISAETALIYRAFANFRDPRLPAQLRGAPGADDELALELQSRLPQLSAQAQATLRPFLLPPFHAGSWWDLRRQPAPAAGAELAAGRLCESLGEADTPLFTDWQYVDSNVGHARIWWQSRYPEDAAKARAMSAVVDTIWADIHALMNREPPDDGGGIRPCRGGDDRLDISLVDMENLGEVIAFDSASSSAGPKPTFMLLNRIHPSTGAMRATLIHEIMHVFQFAFAITSRWEYIWWMEATATWSINYVENVEPGWLTNWEHAYALPWLQHPELALEARTLGHREYGAYLLPLYMQLTSDPAGAMVRQSFERSETMGDSLENLNGLLPGGFRESWPRFTLRNLNRKPVDDYYSADKMPFEAKLLGDRVVALGGAGDRTYELDGEVAHLTSHAYRFRFADPQVRSVLFVNPFGSGSYPTAAVRALVRIDGQWREEDWTKRYGQVYCRDLKAERVEELMIVLSNSEWKNRAHVLKPAYPPRLNVTNVACRGWRFEGDAHQVVSGPDVSQDETNHVSATFLRHRDLDDDGTGRSFDRYQIRPSDPQATAAWSHAGSQYNCSGKGGGSLTPEGGSMAMIFIRMFATNPIGTDYVPGDRRYSGYGGEGVKNFLSQYVMYKCPSGQSHEYYLPTVGHWLMTETQPTQQVSADGTTIKGKFVYIDTGNSNLGVKNVTTYTWTMTALPPE